MAKIQNVSASLAGHALDAALADYARRQAQPKDTGPATLTEFAHLIKPDYEESRLTRLMCSELEAVERGDVRRLMIFTPPREGKSLSSSQLFPAWLLGRNPSFQLVLSSYNDDLAERNSRMVRDIVMENEKWPYPECVVRPDVKGVSHWETTKGGVVRAAGVSGGATGFGAHCVPAGTIVETEDGPIEVVRLIQMSTRPRVLAYDHEAGCLVWRRILATKESKSGSFTDVITGNGRTLRTTRGHRYFDVERGYRPASRLRPGNALLSLQKRVPSVRSANGPALEALSGVPSEGQNDHHSVDLRFLQYAVREIGVRISAKSRPRSQDVLLLQSVQDDGPQRRSETGEPVSSVWWSEGKAGQFVLLRSVPQGRQIRRKAEAVMSTVRGGVHAEVMPDAVLLQNVRESRPFQTDAGAGQLAFQGRVELHEALPGVAPANPRAGRGVLRDLPQTRRVHNDGLAEEYASQVQPHRASHRRGPTEQRTDEPGERLHELPHHPPQVSRDTVAVVSNVRADAVPVYDLQVEGTNNFFANGILVHNCLIIDDYCKNSEEAMSEPLREKAWLWYSTVARLRLMRGGRILVVATRWHEDDLAGRILNTSGAAEWRVVSVPMESEGDGDVFSRPEGEYLNCRIPEVDVPKVSSGEISGTDYNALYQQRPSSLEGNMFKRDDWVFYDPDEMLNTPGFMPMFTTVDTAFKTQASNDWSVAATWGQYRGRAYLIDLWRAKVAFPQLILELHKIYKRWQVPLIIEDRASGQSAIQVMGSAIEQGGNQDGQAEDLARALSFGQDRIPIVAFKIPRYSTDISLAQAVTPFVQAHAVCLPKGEPWIEAFVDEHAKFPAGSHNDQVRTTAMALPKIFAAVQQTQTASGKPRWTTYRIGTTMDAGGSLDEVLSKELFGR